MSNIIPVETLDRRVQITDPLLTDTQTFTGSDVRALIVRPEDDTLMDKTILFLEALEEALSNQGTSADLSTLDEQTLFLDPSFYQPDRAKQSNFIPLLNLQSITVSTFRTKPQVRALGTVNPRGFARGSRTSAGTMILTEFEKDVFWDLVALPAEPTPSTDMNLGDAGRSVLPDQIAPFDLILVFNNELGAAAYRYIYGIEIVTNGIVYSIQDLYHEDTVSFMCRDITPLQPLNPIADLLRKQNANPHARHRRISTLSYVENGTEIVRRFRLLKASRDPFK
jgi:hypothetical protein